MSEKIPPFHPSPVFSERPMNPGPNDPPARAVTFPDVAMRLAHDGPMYAVIIVAGVMAAKGHASASESIIAGLGALLARSFPRAIQVGGASAIIFLFLSSCTGVTPRHASYGAELGQCTVEASTCEESIRCENAIRLKYPLSDGAPREMRSLEAGCE